ncbi:MAG: hypothetical protein RIC89_16040, partial [Pseudomonadales bacterium]
MLGGEFTIAETLSLIGNLCHIEFLYGCFYFETSHGQTIADWSRLRPSVKVVEEKPQAQNHEIGHNQD